MSIHYFPDSDMLAINLSSAPAKGGVSEVVEGILFSYDEEDRLVSIEIDAARKRVDLKDITANPPQIVDDSDGPIIVYTVSELAKKWDVVPRTIQKTIQAMAEVGIEVGKKQGPTYPILLSKSDADEIRKWREKHTRGRPLKSQV